MSNFPTWQVYAIRYASVERTVHGNFLYPDGLKDGPMRLDFFFWACISDTDGRAIVVDTGFNHESARRRNRQLDCDPASALSALQLEVASIDDVVITHLHYDHAGNFQSFPHAVFHIQKRELNFAVGPHMCEQDRAHFFEVDDVAAAVRALHAGRVRVHDGDVDIAPGVSLHLIGGHTDGLQVVRVRTARGWVVLASDATHYFANKALRNPFPATHDVDHVLRGYDRLDVLADSPAHIIPGHDPELLRIYQHRDNALGLDIACAHTPPLAEPRIALAPSAV